MKKKGFKVTVGFNSDIVETLDEARWIINRAIVEAQEAGLDESPQSEIIDLETGLEVI